jgi:cytochrome P450
LKLEEIDLVSPSVFARGLPHEQWRFLRQHSPVHWQAPSEHFVGFWSITRHQDILAISMNPELYSSAKGMNLAFKPGLPAPQLGKSITTLDPPRHGRVRRIVRDGMGFTVKGVARIEPYIKQVTNEVLDRVVEMDGACDFVTDVVAPIPVAVICRQIGVPHDEWDMITKLIERVVFSDDHPLPGMTSAETRRHCLDQGKAYFTALAHERRARPREDLISVLASAELDGERLSDDEISYTCTLMIAAGNDTTRHATSGGLLALLQHPDQRQRVIDEPGLMKVAVEEILRWTTPIIHMARTTTRETELGGKTIAAGDWVVMWYPSGNRDETAFVNPHLFDVGRTPNEHLSFGGGGHYCLGANLGKVEVRVILEEVLRRLGRLELAGDPEFMSSAFSAGIKRLPIRFEPR